MPKTALRTSCPSPSRRSLALLIGPTQAQGTRINVNTAGHGELMGLPGVGKVIAQRIIDSRAADGPFRTIDDLLDVIDTWHREGRTVLAVLHDFDEVRRRFPEAMLLARELIAHGPTETVLTAANLTHARAVSEAVDDHAPICRRAA